MEFEFAVPESRADHWPNNQISADDRLSELLSTSPFTDVFQTPKIHFNVGNNDDLQKWLRCNRGDCPVAAIRI